MIKPRPVQQLVPAGDAATGRSPDAGQRLIPADEQHGSPKAVESLQPVEALAAPSWEDCERKFWEMQSYFGKDMPTYRRLGSEYDGMMEAWNRSQDDGAAGGNDQAQRADEAKPST